MQSNPSLPETYLAEPWELVSHDGRLRLAYMVTYFGAGIAAGALNGARGYLVSDTGELEQADPVIFTPAQLHKSWMKCPTAVNLGKARERFAVEIIN